MTEETVVVDPEGVVTTRVPTTIWAVYEEGYKQAATRRVLYKGVYAYFNKDYAAATMRRLVKKGAKSPQRLLKGTITWEEC